MIKTADWVVDLGPGGGEFGGDIIAEGTPEDIIKMPLSLTGRFLKKELKRVGGVISNPVPAFARMTRGNDRTQRGEICFSEAA